MNTPELKPPLVTVKLAPGHEDDEKLLERTDIPAMGWPTRVYREGNVLKADVDQVPDEVADLIRQGRYKKISAEVYPDFCYSGECYGPTLRRIGVLGGELPEVKTLADIPTPANGKIKGLEIFSAGTFRGRTWTTADLDRVCENFDRLSRGSSTGAIHSERIRPGRVCIVFSERRSMCCATRRRLQKFAEVNSSWLNPADVGLPANAASPAADMPSMDPQAAAGFVARNRQALKMARAMLDDYEAAIAFADKRKSAIAIVTLEETANGIAEALAQTFQQLASDPDDAGQPDGLAQEEQVAGYCERFSEQFAAVKMTKADVLAGYRAERKINPKLTAKEFLRLPA